MHQSYMDFQERAAEKITFGLERVAGQILCCNNYPSTFYTLQKKGKIGGWTITFVRWEITFRRLEITFGLENVIGRILRCNKIPIYILYLAKRNNRWTITFRRWGITSGRLEITFALQQLLFHLLQNRTERSWKAKCLRKLGEIRWQ